MQAKIGALLLVFGFSFGCGQDVSHRGADDVAPNGPSVRREAREARRNDLEPAPQPLVPTGQGQVAQDVSQGVSEAPLRMAFAPLMRREDQALDGKVVLTEDAEGVLIEALVSGLEPGGVHAIHIHEHGDCGASDFTSAGDHFAPEGHPHGAPEEPRSHAGDLGNLRADDEGRVVFRIRTEDITLGEAENSVVGRAVIIHAEPDDFETQPTGAAGDRIACGVIDLVG